MEMPSWTVLLGFLFGATIGSFLNVVIYRMPRAISLSNPSKSFCPACKHPLGVLDLFPILSWAMAGGKCRYCKVPIPFRYQSVEILNGTIWAGIWYQYLVAGWEPGKAVAYMLAAATLVAIIFIDWELYIIPDQINAFLMVVGFGYNVYLVQTGSPAAYTWGIPSSVAGALTGVLVLWGITFLGRAVFGKDAMGHGDIKMARGIGAILFPAMAVVSFGLAVVLGAVLGIVQILVRRNEPEPVGEEDGEPYVPESYGSLFKSLVGYVLCLDVVGLFFPKFYMAYFGEDPFAPVGLEEDVEVERTMIPFGPYLALGAIVATVFEGQLRGGIDAYVRFATGNPAVLEQGQGFLRL